MSEPTKPKKSIVAISLPRTFYKKYFDLHLFNDYGSFNDMVRCATRDLLRSMEVRKQISNQAKEDSEFHAPKH